jgi:hypothetical protein
MSPPISRPLPRFIADASQESEPYGRLAERLAEEFSNACAPHSGEAGSALDPKTIRWFPERGWGGRFYVPATGRAAETSGEGKSEVLAEYFGWVSFERPDDGEPGELRARADFTDITAESNPQWKIDLSDDVIAPWRAEGERGGDVTLIWGLPLVRGAVAATAELDGEVADQGPVVKGRFTLVAVDAVRGFGDDMFCEIKLWDRAVREIASESLYD